MEKLKGLSGVKMAAEWVYRGETGVLVCVYVPVCSTSNTLDRRVRNPSRPIPLLWEEGGGAQKEEEAALGSDFKIASNV